MGTRESNSKLFSKDVLRIDPAVEAKFLAAELNDFVRKKIRRYGCVVGVSGGIDSAVVLALCVLAFGKKRVKMIMLPDHESDPDSTKLARLLAEQHGLEPELEDISEALRGFGCYRRRDEAIRRVFPTFDATKGYKSKIVLPQNLLDDELLNIYYLTIITPEGKEITSRLKPTDFLQIKAASNFKQRSRMAMLYYHAELHNYAVVGTANRNEHGQGFFVKYGDHGVDIQPIAHLYKTQVYQLAEYLDVPEEIINRFPTTDTYSAPSTQQEFFFRIPFEIMDLLYFAQDNNVPVSVVAEVMDLSEAQVVRAFNEFRRRARGTEPLRMAPLLIGESGL